MPAMYGGAIAAAEHSTSQPHPEQVPTPPGPDHFIEGFLFFFCLVLGFVLMLLTVTSNAQETKESKD